jgi:predicted nucleic acid-binding protein
MKPKDSRGPIYEPYVVGKRVAVSFVTVGELLYWGNKNNWGQPRIDDLKVRLQAVIIVPYDYEVCLAYADLKHRVKSSGNNASDNDLWIAACAIRHSITLITNNRRHFEIMPGLSLISEAPAQRETDSP